MPFRVGLAVRIFGIKSCACPFRLLEFLVQLYNPVVVAGVMERMHGGRWQVDGHTAIGAYHNLLGSKPSKNNWYAFRSAGVGFRALWTSC